MIIQIVRICLKSCAGAQVQEIGDYSSTVQVRL